MNEKEEIDMDEIIVEAIIETWSEIIFEGNNINLSRVFVLRATESFINMPIEFFNEAENFAFRYAQLYGKVNEGEVTICLKCFKDYVMQLVNRENYHNIIKKLVAHQFKGGNKHASFCPAKNPALKHRENLP